MTLTPVIVAVVLAQTAPRPAPPRPRAEVTPVAAPAPMAPGSSAVLTVNVHLPAGIHVQGDKPRDRSLIATTLTLTPPPGVVVDRVVFPPAQEFVQAGQKTALLVFASDFGVRVHLSVAPEAPAGDLTMPVTLRYQACDDRVCFAPARATAEWKLAIAR